MSQDRDSKPATAKQPPAPLRFTFTMPTNVPAGGELVVPHAQPPVGNEQRPQPPSSQPTGPLPNPQRRQPQTPPQPQGQPLGGLDRAQLQRLCRHLRETDRCPGECVLSRARQDRRLRRFPRMR